MKTFEPPSDTLKNVVKLPYSEKLGTSADAIAERAVSALSGGEVTDVESAGLLSLAATLKAVADGQIPVRQAFQFLKGIAEKKTPNPVVKVEAKHSLDIRAILFSAVEENPQALTDAVERAVAAREEIRLRLGLPDTTLALSPPLSTNLQASPENVDIDPLPVELESLSLELRDTDWKPGDTPAEIRRLSDAGDGND